MSIQCNVCNSNIVEPIFSPAGKTSLSSLGEIIEGNLEVFFCDECGHLQTQEIQNIDEYYDKQYKILIDSEDEDQLYKIEGKQKIYRYDFQAEIALSKLKFTENSNVLEYGAAKGATLKRLLKKRSDLSGYLFDVSEMYVPFWDEFVSRDNQATYKTKDAWKNNMDYVVSFYVLEHVAQLAVVMQDIHSVLKENGQLYFIIPNTYDNIADFVVADHVNHFSPESLLSLMAKFGFINVSIDASTHDSAFIVTGTKSSRIVDLVGSADLTNLKVEAQKISAYWQNIAQKINQFERLTNSNNVAIYGAGFYGSFILSHLHDQSKVSCFIDQNLHLVGKEQFGIPIISPQNLANDVDTIFVGLNPKFAKQIIANLPVISDKKLPTLFL